MKKLFILIYFFTNLFANDIWDQKIYSFGNLMTNLKYTNMDKTKTLNNIKNKTSLYGIGLVQNLQGEILIFNSKPYISYMKNKKIKIDNSFNKKASFLIYANIPKWVSFKVPNTIYNKKQFEEYLEELADEYGIDTYKPFPFLLEGSIKANNYRILTYNTNDNISCQNGTCAYKPKDEKKGSKKKYISSTFNNTMLDTPIKILGFYSFKRGIVTEQYSYTNMNFITYDNKLSGHCKKIMLGKNMILKLPKIQ